MIKVSNVSKVYDNGFKALESVNLDIHAGEIFALLGPNGAGKTTLISTICGISSQSEGNVSVAGFDTIKDFRETRKLIGLVPQELTADAFETVWNTVSFSRGLFGKRPDPAYLEGLLKTLSLFDKKDNKLIELSGGMKRRVLIAKALSHEPKILFLDEPTAGVDVELRKDMWRNVEKLRQNGTTIILTTHYLEEAEEMADRIGVIQAGKVILVEEKNQLLTNAGRKRLEIEFSHSFDLETIDIPSQLERSSFFVEGSKLVWNYDPNQHSEKLKILMNWALESPLGFTDFQTRQSNLEEIFVQLVGEKREL